MIVSLNLTSLTSVLNQFGLPVGTQLRDLGPLVTLAGPNGSGKSRYLQVISTALSQARAWRQQGSSPNRAELVRAWETATGAEKARAKGRVQQHDVANAVGLSSGVDIVIVDLSYPVEQKIADDSQNKPNERESQVSGCSNPGFRNAFTGQHAYVTKIARDLFNGGHPEFKSDPEVQADRAKALEFARIVSSLLGTDIGYRPNKSSEMVAELFGRPYNANELSSGQKILLTWAIVLHQQGSKIRDSIVLIDEPENHLHPDVCIRAIESLRRDVLSTHGQIWLATHSIPLVAWAGGSSLYSVSRGTITYAGNRVADVIDTLSGGPEGRMRLHRFLSESHHFGFFHFLAECLVSPGVAASAESDPQENSFAEFVQARLESTSSLRVLDFGAGKGRLARALARCGHSTKSIQYFAYDPSDEHKNDREASIQALRSEGGAANELVDLSGLMIESEGVDLVILCNVLHEVPPADWGTLFRQCRAVLRPQGSLIVIEDQQPPMGELPHDKGFLLLQLAEMQQLFGGTAAVVDRSIVKDQRHLGRLTIFEVPVGNLDEFTEERKRRALEILRERAREAVVRAQRDGKTKQRDGAVHALNAMLWMSAKLALGES